MFFRFRSIFSAFKWKVLLHSAIVVGLCGLLWHELDSKGNLGPMWQTFLAQSRGSDVAWLLAALLLMPLNPVIETQKWYPLVLRYESITWLHAFRAVLAGATLSIFSPNRLGEYAGRILLVSPHNQWKALMAQVAGGIAQFLVMIVFGSFGALWVLKKVGNMDDRLLVLGSIVAIIGSVSAVLVYFNFRRIIPMARRIAWLHYLKRYVKDVSVLEQIDRRDLGQILAWSAFRFAVSCCQYYFLLKFFAIETGVLNGVACICSIFLLQTCMPLPPLASFFARGNVAIWVWGFFGANEFSSLATSFLLWIINLFLPAFIGTFSIFYVNTTKAIVYENE